MLYVLYEMKGNCIIMDKVFIIAEIGVNHNGDIDIAKKLIDVAKNAGVDAVKFQSYSAEKEKIRNAPLAEYQKQNTDFQDAFEMSKKLQLSIEEHLEIKRYCDKVGIEFFSTCSNFEYVDLLEELEVNYYKISSNETNNFPLLKYTAEKNKQIILSTGMSTLYEIDECVEFIRQYNDKKLTILHCVSLYPTDFEELNLNFIKTLKQIYSDCIIGFSDHTIGSEASIAAVALGAKVIEKHITLDKNMKGPDHKSSMDPDELRKFVNSIRNIEKSLGSNQKVLSKREKEVRDVSRKSIIANKRISKGEVFNEENLCIKKPGTGMPANYLNLLLGREATIEIKEDTLISWNMVGCLKDEE